MNKIIFSIVISSAFFFSVSSISQSTNAIGISAKNAQPLLEDGAILVDVREDAELAVLGYHVDNMMHIPLSQFDARLSELPKDKKLVLACRSGSRSTKALKALQAKGYTNLLNLDGGITAWQAQGFPVVINGVIPQTKACCSKKESEAKGCCSSKKGSNKADCSTKEKAACASKKTDIK